MRSHGHNGELRDRPAALETVSITIRVTREEAEAYRRIAAAYGKQGITLSSWIRMACRHELAADQLHPFRKAAG